MLLWGRGLYISWEETGICSVRDSGVRRIKCAMAKELVEIGYFAGVVIPSPEGGYIEIQGKK